MIRPTRAKVDKVTVPEFVARVNMQGVDRSRREDASTNSHLESRSSIARVSNC